LQLGPMRSDRGILHINADLNLLRIDGHL
jgi:hypothetical protein